MTATTFHNSLVTRAQCFSVIAGASTMLSLAFGMRQSFGLFMLPMTTDLGMSASDFAFAIALQNIVWGFTQPMTGAFVDRYGARWVGVSGGLFYAVGLAVTAIATDTLTVIFGMGVLVGLGMGATSASIAAKVASKVVNPARWSAAFGFISGAGSIGSFIAAPLAQGVIQSDGWRMAAFALVALAAAIIPAAWVAGRADKVQMPTVPNAVQQTLTMALREAGRHGGYIMMSIAFFVCGLQLVFLATHLPTYIANCGLDPMVSAQALALIGGFNILGSWLFGWLGDRYSRRRLLGFVYLLRSAIIAVYFMMPASQASTLLFAAAMGLLWLGVIPLVNGLVAQIFGIRYLATLTGVAFMSHQVGSFIGAWGGGLIYDALGSYDLAWQIGVLIGVLAAALQLLMDDRPTSRVAAERAAAA
jgi:predicted MFS family arabinose efflux permease